jgi:hypothetical protein
MIIAWVMLVSTGIVSARYAKDVLADRRLFGVKLWFIFHWPIMVFAFVLSIISLLVILSGKFYSKFY